jgi:hypothetical protein
MEGDRKGKRVPHCAVQQGLRGVSLLRMYYDRYNNIHHHPGWQDPAVTGRRDIERDRDGERALLSLVQLGRRGVSPQCSCRRDCRWP